MDPEKTDQIPVQPEKPKTAPLVNRFLRALGIQLSAPEVTKPLTPEQAKQVAPGTINGLVKTEDSPNATHS